METLSLPAPIKSLPLSTTAATTSTALANRNSSKTQQQPTSKKLNAPSYEERCAAALRVCQLPPEERRSVKLFVPRSLPDFDDGGAFPEIHVAQYPRHMGNPHLKNAQQPQRALLNVEVDHDTGDISYDAIVKGGTNANKIVYTRHEDLRGGEPDPEDVALPTEEEEEAAKQRTMAALQAMVQTQTALDKPSGSALANVKTLQQQQEETQFVKYTPRPDAPGYNPAAAQRVIQMVPAQVDPMMPPKHRHFKAPRGPAEDPVPVLQAPPPKLTKEERDAWNIPACISNWKNARGYTIPLDKRLAADGRHLLNADTSINSNFATLSESLYVAERQARKEVQLRSQVQRKLALQEREEREAELRKLAQQARQERSNIGTPGTSALQQQASNNGSNANEVQRRNVVDYPDSDEDDDDEEDDGGREDKHGDDDKKRDNGVPQPPHRPQETEEEVAARQRDRLRLERKRERERELRLEQSKHAMDMQQKRQRLEAERDVSEKVALGVHTGSGGAGGDVDARLYNQSAGFDSGFGAEDDYNVYSQAMFGRSEGSTSIYRPSRGDAAADFETPEEQVDKLRQGATTKFQADQGFSGGAGPVASSSQAGPRVAPVQFEKKT
jgi:SNW domain-containing protein 1